MAEIDITPGLLKKIRSEFNEAVDLSPRLRELRRKIQSGSATYADAYKYAELIGGIQSDVFLDNLTADILPNGKLYYNIAVPIFNETLSNLHDMSAEFATNVQSILNEKSGIGLKAIKPAVDQKLIDGFVERMSHEEAVSDADWMFDEPVKTFSRMSVDSTVKRNAEFQHGAGIEVSITRNAASSCCEWCSGLDGTYIYPGVPNEVFARHEHCKCSLDYNGKKLGGYKHSFR